MSAAAYATAANANASVTGAAQANLAYSSVGTSTALQAADSALAANGKAQLSAANQAVSARNAADAKSRSAAAARATKATKLRGAAAASAKAAIKAEADRKAAAKAAAARKKAAAASRSASRAIIASGNPQSIAASMLPSYGWGQDQMSCLVSLWNRESGWRTNATNPGSGAYGIPQSLPGSKMASAGADWQTNPATQIKWGLGYIKSRYGSPCGAWGHSQATGWY